MKPTLVIAGAILVVTGTALAAWRRRLDRLFPEDRPMALSSGRALVKLGCLSLILTFVGLVLLYLGHVLAGVVGSLGWSVATVITRRRDPTDSVLRRVVSEYARAHAATRTAAENELLRTVALRSPTGPLYRPFCTEESELLRTVALRYYASRPARLGSGFSRETVLSGALRDIDSGQVADIRQLAWFVTRFELPHAEAGRLDTMDLYDTTHWDDKFDACFTRTAGVLPPRRAAGTPSQRAQQP